ncbi:hypothetical protein BGZ67_001246 [Mortierella alpina]|nr:hypothetical protein BGZ67_001246 [Mortierella alpina]
MSSDLSVHASTCLVSLDCKAALSTLPPELLSRIGSNLSLHEYSFLSRTCSRLHQLLFHPAEVVYFLKVRYRFSNESGSIIIFAYLANMLARAPLVLERIFDDFFADSVLHLLEEQQRRRQRQAQRQRLNEGTYQLSQAIAMSAGAKSSNCSGETIAIQRLESLEQHKDAEAARRQAKWEAIRMLGVLYALDKTHVGVGGRFHVRATSATESVGQYQEGRTHPILNAMQLSGRFQPASVETKAPMPEPVKTNVTLDSKRVDENMDMSFDRVMEQTPQQPVQPLQHRRYQIPNRVDKIAFLTKYTDRMHLKLQALEIKDWGQADIQRKKTYQLMIQHNDKTGEKDLVNFYLGRYGGSVQLQDDGQDQELQQQTTVTAIAAG